jgi:hypothetical protein
VLGLVGEVEQLSVLEVVEGGGDWLGEGGAKFHLEGLGGSALEKEGGDEGCEKEEDEHDNN